VYLKFSTGNYSIARKKRPLACFERYLVTLPTRSATQSLYLWPSGFYCCKSGCLELSVWRTPWTVASCGQFQTVT